MTDQTDLDYTNPTHAIEALSAYMKLLTAHLALDGHVKLSEIIQATEAMTQEQLSADKMDGAVVLQGISYYLKNQERAQGFAGLKPEGEA